MNKEKIVYIKLPSGLNVSLTEEKYKECYCDFDEYKYFAFNNAMNGGFYFPQIMQFIFTMYYIFNGYTGFLDILKSYLIMSCGWTIVWYLLKLYKIPFLSLVSAIVGGNIFRFFLHYIVIAIIAIFMLNKWQIIVFCMIGGFITTIINSFFIARLSNVKYNDEIASYIHKFKTSEL